MFGLNSLDVMIGIITIYLIFSLACTAIVEALSSWVGLRGINLQNALHEMFQGAVDKDGNNLLEAFKAHPKIYSLSRGVDGIPSYIDPALVGEVVTSLLSSNDKKVADTIDGMKESKGTSELPQGVKLLDSLHAKAIAQISVADTFVKQHYGAEATSALKLAIDREPEMVMQKNDKGNDIAIPNPTKAMLKTLLNEIEREGASFSKQVADHFDAVMDRASGWYKRHTQLIALIVSAILVIGANVDTLKIARTLSTNPEVTKQMVELAQKQLDAAKKQQEPSQTGASATSQTPASEAPASAVAQTSQRGQQDLQNIEASIQNVTIALNKANADLTSTGIQLGWKSICPSQKESATEGCYNEWKSSWSLGAGISKIFGLLISILAISLGAPFWFDALNRVMQIRTAGVSPREK